ncbi:MAG: hypothetical protein IKN56_06405 [Clostridia bacterium]|nr:hypothetical protein [Clostridia bacterium]
MQIQQGQKAAENRQYNQKTLYGTFKLIKDKGSQEVLTTRKPFYIFCLFVFRLNAKPLS